MSLDGERLGIISRTSALFRDMPRLLEASSGRVVRGILITLLLLGGLILVGLRKLEGLALYPAPEPDTTLRAPTGVVWELHGPNGITHALYLEPKDSHWTIVTFHGNGQQLGDMLGWVSQLSRRGFGALLVEYPGYGLSASRHTDEEAIYEDAVVALRHLTELNRGTESRVMLLGESLGTGVAVEMASRGFGEQVVLLSPYTSIPELAELHAPWLPFPRLLANQFDSTSKAPGVKQPVLAIHGTDDSLIPASMGQRLVGRFPRAELVLWQGTGHGGMLSSMGDRVLDELVRWSAQTENAAEQ